MSTEKYQHLAVFFEHEEGVPLRVSFEMLGEARRLMDRFNERYAASEKVIALILGDENLEELAREAIYHGADAAIYAKHPELRYYRSTPYTKTIAGMVTDRNLIAKISENAEGYVKPRYMFYPADSVGRHLSSTVSIALNTGLASDVNKLEVEDLTLVHMTKTNNQPKKVGKVLLMYRPDFSGFMWTTILCLDNPDAEFSPQSCSIIPGVFKPAKRDTTREGTIVEYKPSLSEEDLKVKIVRREKLKKKIDMESKRVIVSVGRGIAGDPEGNIRLAAELAAELGGDVGISLPLSRTPYSVSQTVKSTYLIPDRVIGTSGSKVSPKLYVAVGVSGAIQHIYGMRDAEFVVAINPDEHAPIRDESNILVRGRMEETLPRLLELVRKHRREADGKV